MKKHLSNSLYVFTLLILVFSSCEKNKDISEIDATVYNEMAVKTIAIKKNKESAFFAFTPNNINFLELNYNWYINGELQLNSTSVKSLFQHTFTENGAFTICFEPSNSEEENSELQRICTELNINDFDIESPTRANIANIN